VTTQLLTGRAISDGRIVPEAAVVLDGDRIAWSGPRSDVPQHHRGATAPRGWRPGLTLLPGLVDVHCHGGAGGEFGTGERASRTAAAHHLAHGTTSLVASLASRPAKELAAAVTECATLTRDGTLAGVHLEGPFLSLHRCGAQRPDALRDADASTLALLLDAGRIPGSDRNALLQMTFAPERDPQGIVPGRLADAGVLAAVGHTDTDAATTSAVLHRIGQHAPRGGRPLVTHLFNGMPPLHHRRPGPVAAALTAAARGEAVVELIADGAHLDPATVAMVFATVGARAIALITDAMAASGMPDGDYELAGQRVRVDDGIARLRLDGDDTGSIAGGTATLLEVLRRTVHDAGVPLADAVLAATATPAAALGLPGGSLAAAGPADVLVVDDALHPVMVLRAGRRVPGPGEER